MKYFVFILFVAVHNQFVSPQMLRPPPFNLINRPVGEKMIDAGNFINQPPPTVIREPPCNSIVPIPNIASPPSTTLITDCSPTICQNLANTIQLMIVCNLLQNSKSSELALQLATPILNEVMASPVLTCGCNNPIPISPNVVSPNFSPNVITPNFIPSNVVGPNFGAPNIFSPNVISPNVSPPRVVGPTNGCANNVLSGILNNLGPNSGLGGPANAGLINTIMSVLGNIQG